MAEGKPTRAALYARAEQMLRERHVKEFHQIVRDLYAEHGYTYTRRLTADERAERERAAKVEKLRQKRAELEAELAAIEGVPAPQAVEKGVDVRTNQAPFGGVHPVDPDEVARMGIPV